MGALRFFIGFEGTDGDCARACEEHSQKAPMEREGEQSQPGLTVALDLHSTGGFHLGEGRKTPPPPPHL